MKKVFIATMAILMAWSFGKVNAQEEFKPFRFGLHASPSISWIKPDLQQEYNSKGIRLGFSYGLLAEFNISNNYSLSTGIDISYFGGTLDYNDQLYRYNFSTDSSEVGDISTTYKLQYIQIPLLIKMSTNEIGYFTYFANIGLGTNILLNASATDKHSNSQEEIDDISDDVAFFRESLIIGLGAEYSIAKNVSIVGAVNFNNGFTTTIKRYNHDLDKKGNAIANYIDFKIGILF